MRRPFRVWCAAVVGLGVVVGCAKKPDETVSGNTPSPTSGSGASTATPVTPGRGAPPPAAPTDGPDWSAALGTVAGPKPVTTTPAAPVTAPVAPVAAPPTTGSGEITVAVCKFDGVEKQIASAKGKVILIDCWATWCPPCVASFPKLVEKHEKYAGKGLAVISLSTDRPSDAPKVIDFLKKQKATFTNLHMTVDAAAQKGLQEKFLYRNAIPHAVLFDRTGNRVWAGHPMDPKLTPMIEAELAKGGGDRS